MPVNTAVINCPVCQYQNIRGNICPNCDTDISIIRALTELKNIERKEQTVTKLKMLSKNIFLLIALATVFSFFVGVWFSYWSFSGMNSMQTITQAPVEKIIPAEINSKIPETLPTEKEKKKIYQVKNGDSLFQVAEKLCGDSSQWKKFVMSNEALVGREGYLLNVSETLIVPAECQGI